MGKAGCGNAVYPITEYDCSLVGVHDEGSIPNCMQIKELDIARIIETNGILNNTTSWQEFQTGTPVLYWVARDGEGCSIEQLQEQ